MSSSITSALGGLKSPIGNPINNPIGDLFDSSFNDLASVVIDL